MSDEVLESYVRQTIEAAVLPEVTFAWQGGEPTLLGIPFYARAFALQARYRRRGMVIRNTLQTNGTLLDDAWCAFLREHDVLVGLSLDGPEALHDAYRVDRRGQGTFAAVWRGLQLLQAHSVAYNILTTVNAANVGHPLTTYRFLRDEAGAEFIQFVPVVERDNATGFQEGDALTPRSVSGEAYGRFLIKVFDDWLVNDVGRVHVQMFDEVLGAHLGAARRLCVHSPRCGRALALEHNGDIYACDHYVEPAWRIGNLLETPLATLANSPQQTRFGRDKFDSLPKACRECSVLALCWGGCPKDRVDRTADGRPGLNHLCAGYFAFFTHVGPPMRKMAALLRAGRPAADIRAPDDQAGEGNAGGNAGPETRCACGQEGRCTGGAADAVREVNAYPA